MHAQWNTGRQYGDPDARTSKNNQTHTGKDLFFLELVQRGRIHACACMLVGPFAVPSRHL